VCIQFRGFSSRVLKGEAHASHLPSGNDGSGVIEDRPVFDSAFYEKLIADILNHEVSIDEAVELE
jgi:hypothetical protein